MGTLLIVVAPSGAGKTSLIKRLLAIDPQIRLSISTTTRPPRDGETDGVDYHFRERSVFLEKVANGDFLEWADVYGNLYGTEKQWVTEQLALGQDVLLEIDVQGAKQVQKLIPSAVSIFIMPPSLAVLRARLENRNLDAKTVIEKRLAAAQQEVAQANCFDYVVINDDFESAVAQLAEITRVTRLSFPNQRLRHPALFDSWSQPA